MHHLAELGSEKMDFKGNVRKSAMKYQIIKRKAVEQSRAAFFNTLIQFSKAKLPETPTPHLLLSNNAPSEYETRMLTDCIHQAQADMECYLEQLTRENTWRGLTLFRHDEAAKFVSEHKAVISPIRRLPPEILQEIFLYAVDAEPKTIPWHHVTSAPYGLSQVSALWRKTALNTPILWTRIPTIHIERQFTTKPRYLAFLAEILFRTHGAPLELYFYGPDYMATDDPHPAIEMLIANSVSWKSLTIEISSLELSIFDAVKGRLPMLETLIIRGWYFISPVSDIAIDIFRNAPRLREVTLFYMKSKMVHLPFSQLVHYDQEEGHSGQFNILFNSAHLSTLKTLSLRMTYEIHISLTGPLITLSALTVLKLRFKFSTSHYLLLDQLFLPVLEELLVDSYVSNRRYPIGPIASLITRGGQACPLKKLYIRSFSTNYGELTALLRQTPFLTHLNTDIPKVDDLQSLIHDRDQILPRLRNCGFFAEEPLHQDYIDLCHMLAIVRCEQRHSEFGDTMHHSLQVLYIHYPDDHVAADQQKCFQRWLNTPASLNLSELRTSIIDCFPELASFSRRYFTSSKRTSRHRKQASSILSSLKEVAVHDANEIYVR